MPQSKTIQEHNDRFRAGDEEVLGNVVITAALMAHLRDQGQLDMLGITNQLQRYNQFTEDNDPNGEHDFGIFVYAGETCYWKIDLFNPTMTTYPDDPIDLSATRRVLTIMLASDY